MAAAHQVQINKHMERVNVLTEYIAELDKPGFKLPSVYVKAGTTQRSELFIVQSSNTAE
jgi:hypothetical protein